jgi:hypothetical protein
MKTQSVDVVLSRPGIYVMASATAMAFCEVDHEGRCYQLRPADFARDGELRPGGWILGYGLTFYGPLARVPS